MKRAELVARILISAAVIGAVGVPLYVWARTPLVHARTAEAGGWNPSVIYAKVGQPLHLSLTSDDVVHGFAVGSTGLDGVDILPGKVTRLTLTFDRPGTYTFYCTRWCGLNHWRMRGTIEVTGESAPTQPAAPPLYAALGLDLDAPHEAPVIPDGPPSALRGGQLAADLQIAQYLGPDFYRGNSPFALFEDLNVTGLGAAERWAVVAHVWKSNTTAGGLENGQKLFVQNCAACHGADGAGDGVFADDLKSRAESSGQSMPAAEGMTWQAPADFTNPTRMLGASPALLQGKILRGGMGTGMPMWGSIFTDQQIWDLVAYLYSFQFDYAR
jgi:mono/diheme cytochrome c family protein/plastocyanin